MTLEAQAAAGAIDTHGALQQHDELGAFLEYVRATLGAPRRILEVGCAAGGMLYAWRALYPFARIVGVDLEAPKDDHGATIILGDSHELETFRRAAGALDGRASVVFIDGDHELAGVRRDIDLYGPLVIPGGLLCLHDIANGYADPELGVPEAWAELLELPEYVLGASFIGTGLWGGIGVAIRRQ